MEVNEISLSNIAKIGVGYIALKYLKDLFKANSKPITNRNIIRDYANQLIKAVDNKQAVIAIAGILNVCSTCLLRIDKLSFLGNKIMDIVKSDTLKQYIES
jgi:hypothetical protein